MSPRTRTWTDTEPRLGASFWSSLEDDREDDDDDGGMYCDGSSKIRVVSAVVRQKATLMAIRSMVLRRERTPSN